MVSSVNVIGFDRVDADVVMENDYVVLLVVVVMVTMMYDE